MKFLAIILFILHIFSRTSRTYTKNYNSPPKKTQYTVKRTAGNVDPKNNMMGRPNLVAPQSKNAGVQPKNVGQDSRSVGTNKHKHDDSCKDGICKHK